MDNRCLKIAKFTIDEYSNYGNLLQSYALQQVLLRYAVRVDSIWAQPDNYLAVTWWRWRWKEVIKFLLNWRSFRSKMLDGSIGWEMARQVRMRDFAARYLNIRRNVDLSTIDYDYDYCVVGSDQVWNPFFSNYWHFFLGFVPYNKRISYAASISVPKIPEKINDDYIKALKGMKCLSLREDDGAKLVGELTGRQAMVHFDPTLLLTSKEWRKISRPPVWEKDTKNGFMLTYFLGNRPMEIDKIAQKFNLRVINLLDKNNYDYYLTSVDEFLWAIDNASILYTDSFHGTVFAILFKTPFVVCNRIGSAVEEKMGSRIDTLLGYFGLEARRGTKNNNYAIENPLAEPDWSQVDEVLTKERKRSDEYLRQALKVDEV